MPIGEPWPYPFPWWGLTPPPRWDYPATWVSTTTSATASTHRCTVRSSPFDRTRWGVVCQRCRHRGGNMTREEALTDALNHQASAREFVT